MPSNPFLTAGGFQPWQDDAITALPRFESSSNVDHTGVDTLYPTLDISLATTPKGLRYTNI